MFPSALISDSLDKLLSAMLYVVGLKESPVWDIVRPMSFYGLADNAEINSLIDTKRPVLLCKSETSQFKDITSVWVPNRNMRPYQKTDKIGLAGVIVHCSPYFVYGQITYVYYGGYMFTESKKFSILPYSTFVLVGLIKRVALGNTLNLHSKILGEIEKKHNNLDTLLLISGVDENRLEIDAFEFDINDEKEFTAEFFNSNARDGEVIDKVDETTLLKNMLADMTGMMTEVLARLPAINTSTNQEQPLNSRDELAMDIKMFDKRTIERAASRQSLKPFGMVTERHTSYPNIGNDELVRLFDNNIRLLNGRLGDIEDKNVALEKRLLMIEKKFYREGISLLD